MISSSNLVVQGFWSGPLTTMERLSMQSFLYHGHRYALYCYDPPAGVPAGVEVRDAREILPESELATFRCAQQFSDLFRIKLLLDKGGWHSDLDNVCLRPLDFSTSHVFYADHDEDTISLALAKSPAGSPFLQHCHSYISSLSAVERFRLDWQAIGTDFVRGAVEYFDLTDYIQPGSTFDPIRHDHIHQIIDPAAEFDLFSPTSPSYSVHLFHALWNTGPEDRSGKGFDLGHRLWGKHLDTDGSYHPDCLYEQLKGKFLHEKK